MYKARSSRSTLPEPSAKIWVPAQKSLNLQVTPFYLRILPNNGIKRLPSLLLSSSVVLNRNDVCGARLHAIHWWCADAPVTPHSLALMGYFNGCLMNCKNLIWLCPIVTFDMPILYGFFILNSIREIRAYRPCEHGEGGCIHSCREVYYFFFKQRKLWVVSF